MLARVRKYVSEVLLMKKIIASLFLTGLVFVSGAAYADDNIEADKSVILTDAEDLVFKTENGEEIVYDKEGHPYYGAIILPDEENRKTTYMYVDGKKHGVAISRFANGKIELETTYANGKKNGDEILFFFNNKPKYRKTYKDNLLDGEEFLYYQDGQIKQTNHYKNGKLNGAVTYFNKNGEVTKTESYKDGKLNGLARVVDKNVIRQEIPYINGKREGTYKTYSSEGSRREIPYRNDKKDGEGKIYSPNNVLLESVIYANDKRNGLYKKFYQATGKLASAENYKDDVKNGISRYFDGEGKLSMVSYYIDGIEMANVQIAKRSDLKNIQDSIFDKQFNKYSNKKNLWYKILWLALNLDQPETLNTLEREMKMYAVDIDDIRIYKRWSGSQFESENTQLFFGLSPLDYAINVSAPTETLQKFVGQYGEKNSRGLTALRDAVRLNKTDMVKFLLLHDADLTETDNDGNDILLYAVVTNSPVEMIKAIIQAGADVNTKNSLDQTPLTVALAQKNTELVKLLIQSGANVKMADGQNLLHYAYDKKVSLDTLKELLDSGLDINATDSEGNNLLLEALKNNDEETALFALENGADINQKDNEGETAVSYVLFHKVSPKITDKIFTLEYDVKNKLEKQNKMLWKVLMEQGNLDLLKETWDKMPDVSVTPDAMGELPIKVALAVDDNPELHKLALSYIKKADSDFVWDAVREKDLNLLKYLLDKGADVNSKNGDGDSLLIFMVKNDYDQQFIEAIKTQDLNIEATDNNNKTALDAAIDKNNPKMAEYLLSIGAKPASQENIFLFITNAKASQGEMVDLLLKSMPEIDMSQPENQKLLIDAVKNLNLAFFKYLSTQKNPDYTVTDENGNSLLLCSADHFAVADKSEDRKSMQESFIQIVKLLLSNGLDINMRNDNGETVLIKLAQNSGPEYDELAKFLIDSGADAQAKDQYNKTAEDYRQSDEEPAEDGAE